MKPCHRQLRYDAATDDELLGLCASGDAAAFGQVARRHEPYLLGFARRYLGDAGAAHDITQNTFVELLVHLNRYDARGQLRAYLRQIALNQCRMAVRSRLRVVIHDFQREPTDGAACAEQVEAKLDAERALTLIDEPLRVIVERYYRSGLSVRDIAHELDLPAGTVKRRLFDARQSLREKLGD